ncbi:MAG TPA: phosphoribosylformylglycinamidine synthase I, partial [Aggregatilineales bacterium]|nr:phosphoribosylformylglycinamidine synthase I [Aggregatilineales bacterium]
LLISAMGTVPDITRTVTADLKQSGNLLYLIGETRDEFGSSHYHLINAVQGGIVPQPVPDSLNHMRKLHQAISEGLIRACHDCSEGGIGVALAEMCIAGNTGADVNLPETGLSSEKWLFSESSGRFIVEVRPEDAEAFETQMQDVPLTRIGIVNGDMLRIRLQNSVIASLSVEQMESAWRGDLIANITKFVSEPPDSMPSKSQKYTFHTEKPQILILHTRGTNRDREAALACECAGGTPEIVHINQLISGERDLLNYHMLILPGGFSYGDDLGAGVLWALDLRSRLQDDVEKFVQSGHPVLGICNGFQALVKSGLLPGLERQETRSVTLTHNESGKFECRWVHLKPNPNSANLFTDGISQDDLIFCPVAHGEGRIVMRDSETFNQLWNTGLIPLSYVDAFGSPAGYPHNPNGSIHGVAALCNPAGNVMGLMPHPEDHIFPWQHPRWHRGEKGMSGIRLFENAIRNI